MLTFTDQFCGAGGSSQGVRKLSEKIKGVEVRLALNHWKLAIETHNTNFPDTLHECTDISACDPRRYPKTDILITSPECTNHSLAKGKKSVSATLDMFDKCILDPAAERSRATMWDVCRFAEVHEYKAIIVENVVDARKWVMWESWLHAMHALGYNHKCVYANSMHFKPTPQSRDRMYIVFWRKGNNIPDLEYTPDAFCECCGKEVKAIQVWKNPEKKFGKYKTQYLYRCPVDGTILEPYFTPASSVIDWTDIGKRIGDRKKVLSDNTLRRIEYGLKKYSDPALIVHNYSPGYTTKVDKPLGTVTCNDHQALLLRKGFVLNDQHSTGISYRVKHLDETFSSVTTMPHFKLIFPPFLIKLEHSQNTGNAKPVTEPWQTQCTRQSFGLVLPQLVEFKNNKNTNPVSQAFSTILTSGAHHGLLLDKSFISYYYGNQQASHVSDSIGTVTTNDRHSLIVPSSSIDDCYFRMIKPSEIKGAMAFDVDYVVLGNGRQQVKQLGNAVTPPVMEWLCERVVESLNQ